MPSAPSLTIDQWNQIYDIVPAKKRNRQLISAIIYRRRFGGGLQHAAVLFDVPFCQMQSWERQLMRTGRLKAIMQALGLPDSANGPRTTWDNPGSREELAVYKYSA